MRLCELVNFNSMNMRICWKLICVLLEKDDFFFLRKLPLATELGSFHKIGNKNYNKATLKMISCSVEALSVK